MRTLNRLSITLSLIAAMVLTSGCAQDQLQRFKETMNVALETTRKAVDTARQAAEMAECMKENSCQRRIK
jgi:hypothetical protein